MKIMKNVLYCCIPLLFLACEEATDWQLEAGDNGQLVVEATLTNESRVQEIRLSQSYSELNGAALPVTDATVTVVANGQMVAFLPDIQDAGLYRSERSFRVIDDLEYTLLIDWQGREYTARTELAAVAPLPPITFQHYGKADSLAFADFAPIYHPDQQAMYRMQVDWSHLSNRPSDRALLYYYTFSSVDVGGLVRPLRDTVFFPPGSVIVARKFGLNDAYADYLRALVIETEWRGGAFYSAAASLSGNISNGALGFFSACAVDADTLVAE
ncbi:DUF4249 family protein [Flavilitoribacter nigricans]|uniref:DUF4249 domain-containing protein n=1 Tax=Flavilitoribacter nigricans (strain ATCC 23147 / DSM 23189 / NBRC 102662 / NCIMB 1420 / SS-2) TaxID=1122177 RepID=A0A2D0N2L7_FLAN2|nr:DUF4249 family protein [Flavilitoribacter nigricans]PHN02636.1 hypothetical protein CRP01_31065 [Flavilitoribacter nigricans DSM 23189 = NBRC 102662]